MKKWQLINFPHFIDERGTLTPFELNESFPFSVKRVYTVTASDSSVTRGAHAHLIEEEIFVAVSGQITARVHDGSKETTVLLGKPNQGLLVRQHCWHEFTNFSADAVMLCFSSTHYLPGTQNYLTDKDEFLARFSG